MSCVHHFESTESFLGPRSMIWIGCASSISTPSKIKITLKSHKLKLSSREIIGRNPPTSGIPRLYSMNLSNKTIWTNMSSELHLHYLHLLHKYNHRKFNKHIDPEHENVVKMTFLFVGWQILRGPGTQMTLVLLEKGLVLEDSTPKIEDKQVPGLYIYIYIYVCVC